MANVSTSYIDISRETGEYRIPIYTATPVGEFPDNASDLVVFGQGIGEIGTSQKRIVAHIADTLGRRVVGYEARLSAQTQNPWDDAVDIARSTHLRVVDHVTREKHTVIGHSLFGLTAGAILPNQQDQISRMTLIAPATITPEAVVSDEWQKMMRNLTLDERAKYARTHEKHWRRHTAALITGFMAVGLIAETVRGIRNPIRSMRAGYDLTRDIAPGMTKAMSAFGVLANVSTLTELEQAAANGTVVDIIVGQQDPVFRAKRVQEAVQDSSLQNRLTIISEGRGQGHSNMATLSGERQIDVASQVHTV